MIEKNIAEDGGRQPGVREAILTAAADLFAQRGYSATSVREVVEAAGCRKPTLYYYFENKEDLYRQVVDAQCASISTCVESVLAAGGTVRERLRCSLNTYLGIVRERPTTLRLVLAAERQPEHGQPRVDLDAIRQRNVEALQILFLEGVRSGELRPDLDVEEAALCLLGMVDYRLGLFLHGQPVPTDYAEQLLDLYFNGVGSCLTR